MSTAPALTPSQEEAESSLLRQFEAETTNPVTSESGTDAVESNTPTRTAPPWKKILLVIGVVVLVIGGAAAALGLYTYQIVNELRWQAAELQTASRQTYDNFKGQNLPASEQGLKDIAERTKKFRTTYQKLAFAKFIPIARSYYLDGEHGLNAADAGLAAGLKAVAAVTPYADVLGFQGQGTFTGGTAEDRLKLILETLTKVTPVLDDISKDLKTVETELAAIDARRYPESLQGRPIRQYVQQAQTLSQGAVSALTEFRPALEQLPAVAGGDGKRKKYLILFQNDNELRPTGGFLTAYSVIFVENGKVTPEKSDDIYELDKKFRKKLPIPEVLGKYLTTEKNWNLRDMNTSPDFKTSMEQFYQNYKSVPGEPQDIDGIFAVDTQVLVDLMNVLGPVEVPGYGTFSAEISPKCDCPGVVYALSEIITRPTPYLRQDRKGILGPMMRALLTKAYTAPKTQWPQMFETAWKNIQGRHAQLFFFDPKAQAASENIGVAGRMTLDPQAQDFIAVIDANLGGAKSNLFTKYEMKQEVGTPSNGQIEKKVTITYRNTHKADNCNLEKGLLCLNSTLRSWNRIYLPKGAKLTNSQGYKVGTVKQYDEGDFTVIDGEFTLEPLSQAKLQLDYTVPYTDQSTYSVKIWKQGGIDQIPTVMDVNGNEEQITVEKDTVYTTKF